MTLTWVGRGQPCRIDFCSEFLFRIFLYESDLRHRHDEILVIVLHSIVSELWLSWGRWVGWSNWPLVQMWMPHEFRMFWLSGGPHARSNMVQIEVPQPYFRGRQGFQLNTTDTTFHGDTSTSTSYSAQVQLCASRRGWTISYGFLFHFPVVINSWSGWPTARPVKSVAYFSSWE